MTTIVAPTFHLADANTQAINLMRGQRYQEAVEVLMGAMKYLTAFEEASSIETRNHNKSVNVTVQEHEKMIVDPMDRSPSPGKDHTSHLKHYVNIGSADGASVGFEIAPVDVSPPPTQTRVVNAGSIGGNTMDSESSETYRSCLEKLENIVYDRAFVLNRVQDAMLAHLEHRTETTAVLLYNTALACHLHAVQGGHTSLYSTAVVLYNMILTHVTYGPNQAGIVNSDPPSTPQTWWTREHSSLAGLMIAVSNNLTHIHLEQWDTRQMRACRQIFRDMLQQATAAGNSAAGVTTPDFTFFHLNLFCLQCNDFCLAPAA